MGAKTLACGLEDVESRSGTCKTISRVAMELDPLRAFTSLTKISARGLSNTSLTDLNAKDGGGGSSKRAAGDVGRSDAMKPVLSAGWEKVKIGRNGGLKLVMSNSIKRIDRETRVRNYRRFGRIDVPKV
jgi:hypothetical protein